MDQMNTVVRHLRRVVLLQDEAGGTDGELLGSFIDKKDEAAFAALVRRHGPMVLSVCHRIVQNHHDSEDAFQATFLVLARKACSIRPREMVVNWLHGVAYRTALKAKAMRAKRRACEKQVIKVPEPQVHQEENCHDLQSLLDQELRGLPENYRLPTILCALEGKSIKEATQHLGWPQGTVAGRLARGRKMLALRLARRGVVLSGGSLDLLISQQVALVDAPISLISSTMQLIAASQAGATGLIPANVAALMAGVLRAMLFTKLKAVTALLFVLGMVTLGSGLVVRYATPAQEINAADGKNPGSFKPEKPAKAQSPQANKTASIARAAVLANQANLNGFTRYKCRFVYTKASAWTLDKALRGEHLNVRKCECVMVVDEGKEKLSCLAPEDNRIPKNLKPDKNGLGMLSVDFIPFTEMRFGGQGLRYTGTSLSTASLLDEKQSRAESPIPVPLAVGSVVGQGSPATMLPWCENGELTLRSLGTKVRGSHTVAQIRLNWKDAGEADYYFDVARGYLPLEMSARLISPTGKRYPEHRTLLLEAKEFSNHRWFPMHVVRISAPETPRYAFLITDVHVSDLEVDKKPTQEDFSLELPAGTAINWHSDTRPFKSFRLWRNEKFTPEDIPRLANALNNTP